MRPNAEQTLRENYSSVEQSQSFREWVELESQSDPHFFRWLFNLELEQDFDSSLTEEQREIWNNFLLNL